MIGYVTEGELTQYADDRGIALVSANSVLLTKALDYIDSRVFNGEKSDSEQVLQFPRDGSADVPEAIKQAQMVAAIIYDGGGDPLAPIGPRILSQTVFGAVARTFSDKGNQTTIYPFLADLLRPFLASSGTTFKINN